MAGMGDFIRDFFLGTPAKRENISLLRPYQEPLHRQSVNAAMGRGAGGAFGQSADYYRNLLSDNPSDLEAFMAPELRRYKEQLVPELAEQFAGMGSGGGLESSGFQNALGQQATSLSERLAAIRANLRQGAAQGLQNIGQQGLNPYAQNVETQAGSEGFLGQISPLIGQAVAAYAGGPASAATNWLSRISNPNLTGQKATASSPYGGSYQGRYGNPLLNQTAGGQPNFNFLGR